MPVKRASWEKARKFFRLLQEGKAPLTKPKPKKRWGRRGKGKFKDFWLKRYSEGHWFATGRFNKVFREMIAAGTIKPDFFVLEQLPRYFVETKKSNRIIKSSARFSVSHFIPGFSLDKPAEKIAKATKAPVEEVKLLQFEMHTTLFRVLQEADKQYPAEFSEFIGTHNHNVIVNSYDAKTKKFHIFVVDV